MTHLYKKNQNTLRVELESRLKDANEVIIASAYVSKKALDWLEKAAASAKYVAVIVGRATKDGISLDAAKKLNELSKKWDILIDENGFHSKIYQIKKGDNTYVFAGSGNLTWLGIEDGMESNYQLPDPDAASTSNQLQLLLDRATPIDVANFKIFEGDTKTGQPKPRKFTGTEHAFVQGQPYPLFEIDLADNIGASSNLNWGFAGPRTPGGPDRYRDEAELKITNEISMMLTAMLKPHAGSNKANPSLAVRIDDTVFDCVLTSTKSKDKAVYKQIHSVPSNRILGREIKTKLLGIEANERVRMPTLIEAGGTILRFLPVGLVETTIDEVTDEVPLYVAELTTS
jgi:HKD family nuclease